jgi:xanthine dehydrogenase accessory factor
MGLAPAARIIANKGSRRTIMTNDGRSPRQSSHHLSSGLASPNLHWLKACQQLEELGQAYVIATVIAYVGSVPRASGAKMVITATSQFDTIGGGNLEYQVIRMARVGLKQHLNQVTIERFSLTADLGQCCGGAVQIMFEYFHTDTPTVAVFGAGHVAQALVTILSGLPCHVKIIDNRPEWLDPLNTRHLNQHEAWLLTEPTDALTDLPDDSYLVIMTQDHSLDFDITKLALEENRFEYIGLIGSQGKKQRFTFRLKEQLSHPEWLTNLTCPIGHPDVIGKLPMQVAVAIAAQLIALFNKAPQTSHQYNAQSDLTLSNQTAWQHANQARSLIAENHAKYANETSFDTGENQ